MDKKKYRINYAEVIQKAHGSWVSILKAHGLDVNDKPNRHAKECPLCGGSGCFRVTQRTPSQTYICKCSNGDGIKLICEANGVSTADAFKSVYEYLSGQYIDVSRNNKIANSTEADRNKEIKNNRRKVANTVRFSSKARMAVVTRYFASRSISADVIDNTSGIRYSRNWYMRRKITIKNTCRSYYCAIFKLNKFGDVVAGLVIIYPEIELIRSDLKTIGEDADSKITPKKPMMTIESLSGSGYWHEEELSATSPELHVAEGIENGLSIIESLGSKSLVCGITAGLMAKLDIPAIVRVIHIWADNGKVGINGAVDFILKNCTEENAHRKVYLHIPDHGLDWNDILIKKGREFIIDIYQKKQGRVQ